MPLQIRNIFARIEKYPSDADVKNRCSTQSGDSCVFPFTYRGKTYSQCITTGDINDKPWCSISTNSKGVHIEGINTWGYCKKSLSCHIWIIIINDIWDWFISVQISLPSLWVSERFDPRCETKMMVKIYAVENIFKSHEPWGS